MSSSALYPDLRDAPVFITGGGSGIGAALTAGFLRQGARVAFVQRSDATAFCDQMQARTGRRPLFLRCDIADPGALEAAIADAARHHGAARVLINNAADDTRHSTADTTAADWNRSMDINLRPVFLASRAVIAGMRQAGHGAIVNLTSISYLMGNAGYPAYVAAKAGITGLTRALAREFGPDRIRVNALAPGWVMTDRQRSLWVTPEALERHLGRQCLRDTLTADDITGAALFLASDASRMITGQVLAVDGGVVATG